MSKRSLSIAALCALSGGILGACASTEFASVNSMQAQSGPSNAGANERHPHRGRAAVANNGSSRSARVLAEQSIACAAAPSEAARCPQCPDEPTNASVERGFRRAESAVLSCNPPALANGRLAVAAQFENNGALVRLRFAGVELTEPQQRCLREALCSLRVPTFQRSVATVRFEYVVMEPSRD
jgi:hypothetical protein